MEGLRCSFAPAFETLTEAGYPPELAYFEVLHELKLIVDLYYEGGLAYMNYSISDTAEYGNYSRGPRLITDAVRGEMRKILGEIQSGQFAKEWIAECDAGWPNFDDMKRDSREHPIEVVGKKTSRHDELVTSKQKSRHSRFTSYRLNTIK